MHGTSLQDSGNYWWLEAGTNIRDIRARAQLLRQDVEHRIAIDWNKAISSVTASVQVIPQYRKATELDRFLQVSEWADA
ncbi:hypothetical protein Dda_6753 [Drechslerella dactyloides]|uniref:Uncharacterized protein n=1 Tax=Drechslerella dactyloides TaxID=74499 RepID=A0AAD6IUA4_DREDA|nr:hypothetical protein Dda_6753 [Drechslerella dactyloides]